MSSSKWICDDCIELAQEWSDHEFEMLSIGRIPPDFCDLCGYSVPNDELHAYSSEVAWRVASDIIRGVCV